jgi:hypothetical protein
VSVAELLAAYAVTAERWHDLRTDARAANPSSRSSTGPGLHAIAAAHALGEFRAGRLDLG